jgi:hypothetical protein
VFVSRTSVAVRLATVLAVVTMFAGCSIPEPTSLVCSDGQSIFQCEASYSDGKVRSLTFVDEASGDWVQIDSLTTLDDFGNPYCITLYDNSVATYKGGEC